MEYEAVIGLEVHVQLKTESKMFCSCSAKFGAEPNSSTCPVCLGMPGSLPVANEKAFEYAILAALALNCEIAERLKFDRKNYFYPDLPKAYQISQYDMPLSFKGSIEIETPEGSRTIGITRAHLEEDAGKLLHEGMKGGSLVDYNRTGTPLLEIVSEPDIRSSKEAYEYLLTLKAVLEYVEVSDCNMEEGSLRCDANVSVRKKGETAFGTKTEVKNLNSFRGVEKALSFEIERQIDLLKGDDRVVQETRLWDEKAGETFSMRSKEEAHDYRYFPEPDLVPFTVSRDYVEKIRKKLPELPTAKLKRLAKDYGLSEYDCRVLVQQKIVADFFEEAVKEKVSPKLTANWITSELMGHLNARGLNFSDLKLKAADLAGLIKLIENGTVSGKIAKDVLPKMIDTGKTATQIVQDEGLVQESDEKVLGDIIKKVISENPKPVEDYKGGKKQSLGFLVGQVMKATKGKANPGVVNKVLKEHLDK